MKHAIEIFLATGPMVIPVVILTGVHIWVRTVWKRNMSAKHIVSGSNPDLPSKDKNVGNSV